MNIQNFHVLTVKYIGATNFKPSRVKIISERFNQSVVLDYDHDFDNTMEVAADWLTKNHFNITGKAEGKNCYYVITDSFQPLKK